MPARAVRMLAAVVAVMLALVPGVAVAAAPDPSGDPLRDEQYALEMTGLGRASGDGVVVAVIDSGVDLDHPDLAGSLVPGIDLVDKDRVPDDPNGHGTHVAGIIAANTGNGRGIAGAAPGALVMPVRVLDEDGEGSDAVAAAGVRWAVAHGAKVINLSVGNTGLIARVLGPGGPLAVAIVQAVARGTVVVTAAGNAGEEARSYRVGVPLLVASAVDADGELAEFTSFGDVRVVSAPGVNVLSTVPTEPTELFPQGSDGYARLDGTSMAAPHVSALAAVLVARGAAPGDVSKIIEETATNPEGDPRLGAGIIDARAATRRVPPPRPITRQAVPSRENEWLVRVGAAALLAVAFVSLCRAVSRRG